MSKRLTRREFVVTEASAAVAASTAGASGVRETGTYRISKRLLHASNELPVRPARDPKRRSKFANAWVNK